MRKFPRGPRDTSVSRQLRVCTKLDSCLGRLGKRFIHFLLVDEQLLDARAILHALEMRRDIGEARAAPGSGLVT